jgi:rod shape-determining protein MreC
MDTFLNRYRNITVLLLVIFAQLMLLAVQVKNDQDVRIIRVWAFTTVTPVARVLEWFRGGSVGFVRNYILMHDASEENRQLKDEVGRLRLQVNFLQNELATADRAKALQVFQAHTESKMLAANIIGTDAGSNSKVVLVNRGSAEGVMRGMAVVTPDGIVGKVIASYPTASQVMLITDPDFAAGVVSQKNQTRGTLKGQGKPLCKVDYVPLGEKVEPGEWFYTSGDDRVFPRGFAVGIVKSVQPAQPFQEIWVEPSGLQHGLEDVLIILEAVHQAIPEAPPVNQPVYIAPPPPQSNPPANATAGAATPGAAASGTEADKLRAIYQSVGETEKHTYGSGPPGTKPPDFTKLPSSPGQAAPPASPAPAPAASGGRAGTEPAAPTRLNRQAEGAPATPTKPPAAPAKQ